MFAPWSHLTTGPGTPLLCKTLRHYRRRGFGQVWMSYTPACLFGPIQPVSID